MSDEGGGFNPCECLWNHELAMRRLLNVLRNSQALCTDNECFETGSTPPGRTDTPQDLYFVLFLMVIGLCLYLFRPRREIIGGTNKPNNETNDNGSPPPIS